MNLNEAKKWVHHCPDLDGEKHALTCGLTVGFDDEVSATIEWGEDVNCPECLKLKPAQGMFTVVVELSHPTAMKPNHPMRAFVLPTGGLSARTYQEFRDAAEKGGCQVQMYTVKASGIEDVKWELMHSGATRLD